jgi:hypothetical protein
VPQVQQGSIIRATVTDSSGGNPKTRPLVVVTGNSDLFRSDTIQCVAITRSIGDPPLQDEILLQWHPQGLCRTKLRAKCGAKCSWLCEVRHADVIEIKGACPPAELELILEQVAKLSP